MTELERLQLETQRELLRKAQADRESSEIALEYLKKEMLDNIELELNTNKGLN